MLLQIFQMLEKYQFRKCAYTDSEIKETTFQSPTITARWIKFMCVDFIKGFVIGMARRKTKSQIDRNIPPVWLYKICSIIPILNFLAYSYCGHLLHLINWISHCHWTSLYSHSIQLYIQLLLLTYDWTQCIFEIIMLQITKTILPLSEPMLNLISASSLKEKSITRNTIFFLCIAIYCTNQIITNESCI